MYATLHNEKDSKKTHTEREREREKKLPNAKVDSVVDKHFNSKTLSGWIYGWRVCVCVLLSYSMCHIAYTKQSLCSGVCGFDNGCSAYIKIALHCLVCL